MPAFDILIKNGTVIDGTGRPGRRADVGINGDRIAAVGDLSGPDVTAGTVIDAAGKVVCPGFIDTHVHSDLMLLADPVHEAALRQGVTTEILGQDGLSYAPLSAENLRAYRRYLAGLNGNPDLPYTWSTVAEFRACFDRTVAVNTAYLVPHGAVRLEAVGFRDVPLVGEALERARRLLAQSLEAGAVGFSTGLSYYPCSWADTEELVELGKVAARYDRPYVTHLRTVFRGEPFDPVEEALEVGRRAGVKVHFSHFRTGPLTAGQVERLLAPIDRAKAEGVDCTLETYPYPTGSSQGVMFLPPWAHDGGPDALLARLRDPEARRRLAREIDYAYLGSARGARGWHELVFSYLPKNSELVGLTFAEAARRRGQEVPELLCDLLLEEEFRVGFWGLPPEPEVWAQIDRDIMALLSRPDYMVGSDAIWVGQRPHPRAYGCFARILGPLRRRFGVPLELLINRMTAVPAARFGLTGRGVLAPGKFADVVVFDPEAITDTSTYEDPRRPAVGVGWVLVNGQPALAGGKPTGILAGRAVP